MAMKRICNHFIVLFVFVFFIFVGLQMKDFFNHEYVRANQVEKKRHHSNYYLEYLFDLSQRKDKVVIAVIGSSFVILFSKMSIYLIVFSIVVACR